AARTAVRQSPADSRSAAIDTTPLPSSAASERALSAWRSRIATLQPPPAKPRTMAAPMPWAPPVTMARRPASALMGRSRGRPRRAHLDPVHGGSGAGRDHRRHGLSHILRLQVPVGRLGAAKAGSDRSRRHEADTDTEAVEIEEHRL